MEIATKYDPSQVEDKWYGFWLKNRLFRSVPDGREPYCIVIPPPNVTGVLHMGHMLNNTIQDILVRRARMLGKNACWVPGTDHASIATEAKVVAKLKDLGLDKSRLGRQEFLDHAWEWKEKHGGIILEQLKKLGASCDWDRTCFTMDEARYESVMDVFIDLYNKGLIYRGARMINWDPKALTAVSDEEVIYKEVQSRLYYVKYRVEDSRDEWVVIATTRPETILGDTAICVHPRDERYAHLKGKHILVPLIQRSIPVIFDEYVDMEFGTGALKVTPAHDINDYKLGLKYKLDVIDTFNPDGTMSDAARMYIGENRFKVRSKIVKDLKEHGHIVKIEDYPNKVGYSERTDEVIEPRISVQWFMRMKELAAPALDAVENDTIRFHPVKYKNMYRHWMENVTDWCISRQLWWGQRIPAWYLPGGEFVVAKTQEEAFKLACSLVTGQNTPLNIDDLKQDEDVLDTWFSSWLWPISVFDGIRHPDNPDIRYYFPTEDLVTAPDIIFFWVARMIMAGYEYRQNIPFRNVYFTGTVRDKLGRKMSKSLGNSPEPIELIKKYGADAVRIGMLLCSPAGNDLLYDNNLVEQGRNFCNKVWNAMRLVKGWDIDLSLSQPASGQISVSWFDSVLNAVLIDINEQFGKYRLSEALKDIYKLVWDDFCSWYLEMIKPSYNQPVDAVTHQATLDFFEKLIRIMHPFMPFITEEIYHVLHNSGEGSIMQAAIPVPEKVNQKLILEFDFIRELIIAVRAVRSEQNIPPREQLSLFIRKEKGPAEDHAFDEIILKLCNLKELNFSFEKPADAVSFIVRTTECYIPMAQSIDVAEELVKLNDEIVYQRGFLESVMKKLGNQSFINSAPQKVIEVEMKKKTDAESRIAALEERIRSLKK
jgi:valyl-tRNA synthetase